MIEQTFHCDFYFKEITKNLEATFLHYQNIQFFNYSLNPSNILKQILAQTYIKKLQQI